jgi:hypothetical protein
VIPVEEFFMSIGFLLIFGLVAFIAIAAVIYVTDYRQISVREYLGLLHPKKGK